MKRRKTKRKKNRKIEKKSKKIDRCRPDHFEIYGSWCSCSAVVFYIRSTKSRNLSILHRPRSLEKIECRCSFHWCAIFSFSYRLLVLWLARSSIVFIQNLVPLRSRLMFCMKTFHDDHAFNFTAATAEFHFVEHELIGRWKSISNAPIRFAEIEIRSIINHSEFKIKPTTANTTDGRNC